VRHRSRDIFPSAELLEALCDDLNTPLAITHLHSLASKATNDAVMANQLYADLVFLGVFADRREEDLKLKDKELIRALKESGGVRNNGHKGKTKATSGRIKKKIKKKK
jgi:cysteinyl-tRNA synthetase